MAHPISQVVENKGERVLAKDSLDHVIALGENDLRRILKS